MTGTSTTAVSQDLCFILNGNTYSCSYDNIDYGEKRVLRKNLWTRLRRRKSYSHPTHTVLISQDAMQAYPNLIQCTVPSSCTVGQSVYLLLTTVYLNESPQQGAVIDNLQLCKESSLFHLLSQFKRCHFANHANREVALRSDHHA